MTTPQVLGLLKAVDDAGVDRISVHIRRPGEIHTKNRRRLARHDLEAGQGNVGLHAVRPFPEPQREEVILHHFAKRPGSRIAYYNDWVAMTDEQAKKFDDLFASL